MIQILFSLISSPRVRLYLWRLWHEDAGQDLVEYALLVVMVALGATAAMRHLAESIAWFFWGFSQALAYTAAHQGGAPPT